MYARAVIGTVNLLVNSTWREVRISTLWEVVCRPDLPGLIQKWLQRHAAIAHVYLEFAVCILCISAVGFNICLKNK